MSLEILQFNSTFLRWWFYQHGRLCAKVEMIVLPENDQKPLTAVFMQNPRMAAVLGIVVVLVSALGLFNPRGKPFVFNFQEIIQNFVQYVRDYAIPRWHFGAYIVLVIYIAVAADNGVKYSTLCRIRSVLGLRPRASKTLTRRRTEWNPPFKARFIVGLCGVLTILFSIVISVAISHSLLGVRMDWIFDELPFLVFFLGVQGVFSLLDASTVTFSQSEQRGKGEVYVVDRVNQIAMATSLTGPEELITAFFKASIALFCFWTLGSCLGSYSQAITVFCAHAGIAVLAKCLLQLSVFATIVQALVPFWDPNRVRRRPRLMTPEVKCRVCFEVTSDLRRSPCHCSGSVGYIHPVCFQQWFEMKKSMRCELCHVVFQVRMLPTSVLTNRQTMQSFLSYLLPPLVKRLLLYLALQLLLSCNKLGILAHQYTQDVITAYTWISGALASAAALVALALPALVTCPSAPPPQGL